jgi:hypothetical protein
MGERAHEPMNRRGAAVRGCGEPKAAELTNRDCARCSGRRERGTRKTGRQTGSGGCAGCTSGKDGEEVAVEVEGEGGGFERVGKGRMRQSEKRGRVARIERRGSWRRRAQSRAKWEWRGVGRRKASSRVIQVHASGTCPKGLGSELRCAHLFPLFHSLSVRFLCVPSPPVASRAVRGCSGVPKRQDEVAASTGDQPRMICDGLHRRRPSESGPLRPMPVVEVTDVAQADPPSAGGQIHRWHRTARQRRAGHCSAERVEGVGE